ncbi:MAG TPA: D-alanyl-D-alanine carboxypeptidase [Candidatus Nitrosotalea sp.]|nr:D-alanyl-D-alanine carboxypeptidase [Candidatus Nitrosotalea sp.]
MIGVLLLIVLAGGLWNLERPVPAPLWAPLVATGVRAGTAPTLPWPDSGESAVALPDQGVVVAPSDPRPQPIASVAKVMTALLTLQAHPLASGDAGPTITISALDVETYDSFVAQDGSVIPVALGEQLTEYQALEALLLPSADNVAILLARWVAGSDGAFVAQMNSKARALGMTQTTFTDPSGLDPGTVSTPTDLLRLAQAALRDPILKAIVGLARAELPLAGVVKNVNAALGLDGIVGIKTGNTDQAQAVYLFEAQVGAQTLIGAIQGLATLSLCFAAAQRLIDAVRNDLAPRLVISAGRLLGHYRTAWGASIPVVARSSLQLSVWPGSEIALQVRLRRLNPPQPSGRAVGTVTARWGGSSSTTSAVTAAAAPFPSLGWRLRRGP